MDGEVDFWEIPDFGRLRETQNTEQLREKTLVRSAGISIIMSTKFDSSFAISEVSRIDPDVPASAFKLNSDGGRLNLEYFNGYNLKWKSEDDHTLVNRSGLFISARAPIYLYAGVREAYNPTQVVNTFVVGTPGTPGVDRFGGRRTFVSHLHNAFGMDNLTSIQTAEDVDLYKNTFVIQVDE
jgi:hypothetical protein